MSRKESSNQIKKPKISKLAILSAMLSLVIGVLGLLILPFATVVHYPPTLGALFGNIAALFGIAALILGLAALLRIKKFRWMLMWKAFAIAGVIFGSLILAFWLQDVYVKRSIPAWSPASYNLQCLAKAMLIYAHENNDQYPEPNQWCDLLLKHGQVDIENFVCPSIGIRWPFNFGTWPFNLGNWPSRNNPFWHRTVIIRPAPQSGRCHFAMNPNCKPDSPPHTVLLFESKEGWNQFGGPELLTTKRHRGAGCYILYNDTARHFERPANLQKLKWGGEKEGVVFR